jgi:hypothetical protein
MQSAGLVLDALGRVCEMVREALKDLSPEELLSPPKPHIAWLVWHLSRVQAANFSGLLERPQLWITDGWARALQHAARSERLRLRSQTDSGASRSV